MGGCGLEWGGAVGTCVRCCRIKFPSPQGLYVRLMFTMEQKALRFQLSSSRNGQQAASDGQKGPKRQPGIYHATSQSRSLSHPVPFVLAPAQRLPPPSLFRCLPDNMYISGNPIYFMYPNKSYFYRLSRACYVAPIGLSHSSRNWHAIGGAKIITKYFISGEIK